MDSIIKVQGLGKQYYLGGNLSPYSTVREAIMNVARKPLQSLTNGRRQTFWALKDLNFEIKQGQIVGIIGRNGAGKSTLLKILSRITEPTVGRVELYGRVASLLEVGTGFHPELSGRENIYLNGSILGMSHKEIESKFDEIVAFAEVEKFVDTPVKRYSSGMYVRLAFAVAAHLEPEILVVDEVLAVGDAEFQKKCLGKMQDISGKGRTVLFVSHNMAAVQTLCTRAILLDQGRVVNDGNVHQVVLQYLDTGISGGAERVWANPEVAPGNEVARLRAVRARNGQGAVSSEFKLSEPVSIEVEFWVLEEGHLLDVGLYLYNEAGTLLFVTGDFQDSYWNGKPRPIGIHRSTCHIPSDFLNEGTISVLAAVSTNPHTSHAIERDAITFHLQDDYTAGGARGNYTREWPGGVIRPLLHWSFEFESLQNPASTPTDHELRVLSK